MKFFKRSFSILPILIISIFAGISLLVVHCTLPFDESMLKQVKDTTAPTIEITYPEDGSSYASTVVIEGNVSDFSADGSEGSIKRVYYTINPPLIEGTDTGVDVEVEEDGSFSFNFPTAGFSGMIIVTVYAEDWNGNVISAKVTLLDEGAIPSFKAEAGNGQVTLSWDPVPMTDSYTIYYETSDIIPTEQFSKKIENATSPYVLKSLKNGDLHTFILKANSSSGDDNWSDVVKALPLSPAHLAPRLIPKYNSIELDWVLINGIDEYEVWKSTSRDGTFVNISGVITGNHFIDNAVEKGVDYYYAIKPSKYNNNLSFANTSQTFFFPSTTERIVSYFDTPGSAEGVAIEDCYVYVADGDSGLRIIDVSDKTNPKEIAFYNTEGIAMDVVVNDSKAYVADGTNGLCIIDISNPFSPKLLGYCDTPGYANDIVVRNNHAYIADSEGGLQIINISSPSAPFVVGSWTNNNSDATGIAVDENETYAYLAYNSAGLRIVDIGDKSKPSEIGSCYLTGNPYHITLSGSYAYTVGNFFMCIVDVSDVSNPLETSNFNLSYNVNGIDVKGDFVYVCGNYQMSIIDASMTQNPSLITYSNLEDLGMNIVVSGPYAYIAAYREGLCIDNIYLLNEGNEVNSISTNDWSIGVSITNNNLYLADNHSGIRIFDSSNPLSLTELSNYDTQGQARKVFVSGQYAYIADLLKGFIILDISSSSYPKELSDCLRKAHALMIRGNYAYIGGNNGLNIIDISDPKSPFVVSSLTSTNCWDVLVEGDLAYLAEGDSGLIIVDVSNPALPFIIGSYDSPGYAEGIAKSGNYIYLADGSSGLRIIDVFNPNSPSEYGYKPVNNYAKKVAIYGSYLFLTDGSSGFKIYSIISPNDPKKIAYYDTPGWTEQVLLHGKYAYIADGSGGIRIIDLWPFD